MTTISTLDNGLTVIVEEMPHFESAAYELIVPGGIVTDAPSTIGASLILAELTSRGAGSMNAVELSNAFDDAGIRHGEGGGFERFSYRGSLVADKLPLAMSLVAKMVTEPTLPKDEVESIQNLFLQDIRSLDDNPSRKALVEIARRYYPDPFSRPSMGSEEGISAVTHELLVKEWKRYFHPMGAILSVAGKVVTKDVVDLAKKHFGSWKGESVPRLTPGKFPAHSTHHIQAEAAQLQITLAYPSAPFGDPLYYAMKMVHQVLSGGMFGRLFIEVREKKGLCYSVYSRHSSTKDYGTASAYAGTTPERAHETLSTMVEVLRGVKGTVTEEELARAKANLKASLIISEESAGARASSNAHDFWLDKRLRSLKEISDGISAVTLKDLDAAVEKYPADKFTLLTLGSRAISLN